MPKKKEVLDLKTLDELDTYAYIYGQVLNALLINNKEANMTNIKNREAVYNAASKLTKEAMKNL